VGFKNKVLLAWNGFSWLGIVPICVLLLCLCHTYVAAWLVHTLFVQPCSYVTSSSLQHLEDI